ncbi:hypothetical protein CROQUDRAFT_88135 [Cronartium quercuum f. sp. fusiforme G11]|uniref:chitin synthase n=1 Tax=Cronartium quercuum f. sp. fusiforme G11 TaxID=708437 RepID=A0A9P6NRJ0_9BASI|nr:hypothetical protein CROQUDRAFT_88135 [Cronartium quercuum f. sp. fusiforme G11]
MSGFNSNNSFAGASPAAAQGQVQDPTTITDLCSLIPSSSSENLGLPQKQQQVTADHILNVLKGRFLSDLPYIWLSPRSIVALAANKNVTINSDQSLNAYATDWRDCSEDRRQRVEQEAGYGYGTGPHVWALAGKAYYYMRRTGGDQSILISGESGSGKSENRRLSIRFLADLSSALPGKKGSKLVQQIPAAQFILESFGNAYTSDNANASRFGQYTELQFTENGKLCGLKTLEYYLERQRVMNRPAGERSFHVFYYLAAGGSPEERAHLFLDQSPAASGIVSQLPGQALRGHAGQQGPQAFRYLTQARSGTSASADANLFVQLKQAFKAIGFPKKGVASTCQLLAAILHLGNLEFVQDNGRNTEAASIANSPVLEVVASFLGVRAQVLETTLTYQTRMVSGERCTVFLDPDGASAHRDELAQTLYGLLFTWLNETINQKLCKDDFATFIALVDLPGIQNHVGRGRSQGEGNNLDTFCFNLANERAHAFALNQLFVATRAEYATEEIEPSLLPDLETAFIDNSEMIRVLTNNPGGLLHIIDDQTRRKNKDNNTMLDAMTRRWGNNPNFSSKPGDDRVDRPGTFTCSHFSGPVTYSVEGFLEQNRDVVSPDFVTLFAGNSNEKRSSSIPSGSTNSFIRQLFSSASLTTTSHPKNESTIVAAQQPQRPMRAPSTRRKNRHDVSAEKAPVEDDLTGEAGKKDMATKSVVTEFDGSLVVLFETLTETKTWFVWCLKTNETQLSNQFDARLVKQQIKFYNLASLARRLKDEWLVSLETNDWWERYKACGPIGADHIRISLIASWPEKLAEVRKLMGWTEADLCLGKFKVFMGDAAFRELEDRLRAGDADEQRRYQEKSAVQGLAHQDAGGDPYATGGAHSPNYYQAGFPGNSSEIGLPLVSHAAGHPAHGGHYYDDDRKTVMTDTEGGYGSPMNDNETKSYNGTDRYAPSRNMFDGAGKPGGSEKDGLVDGRSALHEEVAEEIGESSARKKWVLLVWMLTFFIPNFILSWVGRMKRPDVRMAWREKLAINMIIWFVCGIAVFVIAIMGNLICPRQYVFSSNELSARSFTDDPNNMLVAIRGEVFDLTSFAPLHYPSVVPTSAVQKYGGTDASNLFPVQVSALCSGDGSGISDWIILSGANTTSLEPNSVYHDFRAFTSDSRPDWYYEQMYYLRYNYRRGFMGKTPKEVSSLARKGKRSIAIMEGNVYDLTDYISVGPGVRTPTGTAPPSVDTGFISPAVIQLFQQGAGSDITDQFNGLNMDPVVKRAQRTCLRNLFLVAKVDNRQSAQCQFSQYILLAFSIIMVSIVGFKFLAALQFSKARQPEDHEKFVVIQIPCYTEGEESLRRAIDSITQLKYDDKRKLLFMVCDGMIIGSGNDRPTPRIVLDILGSDPNQEPEALSILSLGEGTKQHNMAKVYSGLYESGGHVVPYIVIAKCGKPTERSRPGNRGKRDSQMMLMRFFNRVHFDTPMSPCELELYHQIKNVIGVNPAFYEYALMIDADTTVDKYSLNRMISAMVHDQRVIGLCGETSLANAKHSWTTMMQVYEYFISHHLAKAFESLFGSVTCLPGCFTLYRMRTSEHKPLLISNQIIQSYSVNRVDTLHMKNLLHLGEDRYLTTLLLKTFPAFKTTFIQDAFAQTIAPDEWKILLSQRRRWINSTIHNLAELLMIERLCGFCCFSMRFIVFIDLFSTLIQPVTIAYLGYLIYLVVSKTGTIPLTSIIMIAAIYGLQALIFIFHRKFEHIGWMFVYLLAIPIFSFLIPLYSFWKMDDFSWGNTRVVLGESGKKLVIHDEGKFDPSSIPLKTWQEYENELWERGSNKSIGSIIADKQDAAAREASLYGQETSYDPPPMMMGGSRTHSPALFDQNLDARSLLSGYQGRGGGSMMMGGGPPQPGMPTPGYGDAGRAMSTYSYGGPQGMMMGGQGRADSRGASPFTAGMMGGMGSMANFMGGGNEGMGSRRGSGANFISPRGGLPSDHQIIADIRSVLARADLNTITKKGVRQQLEAMYGTELGEKKAFVNQAIEDQLN